MRIALLIACLCPLLLWAQINWKTLQKHSTTVLAYRASASDVEEYIKKDSINIDAYLPAQPYKVFAFNEVREDALPKGQYVFVKVNDNNVVSYVTGVTNLIVYPVNNQHRVQLLIRDKNDTNFITNARVWINGKLISYNSKAGSYEVKQKYPDNAIIKVFTPTDTAFFALSAKDELYQSIPQQRRNHFLHSKMLNAVKWLPKKIAELFTNHPNNNIHASGTIIFNQAKYKITDTVKLKAYILNNKKLYKKQVDIYLEYYVNGDYIRQKLAQIHPSAPGAYLYSFPLSDTLPQDTRYTVSFQTNKKKQLITNRFQLEDYLADDLTNYKLRTNKDEYSSSDTIHFFAAATDANGLSVLDGTAKLVVTTGNIEQFYKDSLYIPDTLLIAEKKLATEGETTFDLPASYLPNADMAINANVTFTNSNNEMQDATASIQYKAKNILFSAKEINDSIVAEYKINGTVVRADGYLIKSGDNLDDDSLPVYYPLVIKTDPLADNYRFYITKQQAKTDSAIVQINTNYTLSFINISRKDTVGFQLQNSYRIPVSYTIFNGNNIVAAGTSKEPVIVWSTTHFNKHTIYTVKWQYWWAGEEKYGEDRMGYLYKALSITVKNAPVVFPGQKDSVQVDVRDIYNKPVPNVNLTAVAYNNQFAKDIFVKNLSNLAKYRSKTMLLRDKFEMDDAYAVYQYSIGKHLGWVKKFSLDTLPYYNMLLPAKNYADYVTPLANFNTEVSVHVVRKGEPQEVYLLYLNKVLAYYNGVTDKMHDSYAVFPGYTKIGIRLYNRFIEIDSIYLQPFYKHDLFIDLDSLAAHSPSQNVPNYFTPEERRLLENSIWQLASDYKTNNSYVWQQQRIVELNSNQSHLVGPFIPGDSLHVYAPHNFDVHFRFEPGYEYTLSKQIERLEKKPLFPASQSEIRLNTRQHTEWVLGDTIPDKPVIDYTPQAPLPYIKTGYYYSYTINNNYGKLQFSNESNTKIVYTILYSQTTHEPYMAWAGNYYTLSNIVPGTYILLLVNDSFATAQTAPFIIKSNATLCLQERSSIFLSNNNIVAELIRNSNISATPYTQKATEIIQNQQSKYQNGTATISGRVTDKKGGHGIAGASVVIEGTVTGTTTDSDGYFTINNIKEGKCSLVISAVGYASSNIVANASIAQNNVVYIPLRIADMNLAEVVVVGYGTSRKKDLTGALASVSQGATNLCAQLSGRVSGVMVGTPGSTTDITLRGISNLNEAGQPVYVVDGILYDKLPPFINADMLRSATVLKGAEAVAIYGERAAEGAIIIITNNKIVRKQFRDYAIWQPQLFTNKQGKASFVATYPDNITGWQLYVLGLDKKKRTGKTISFIQSYKPLSAQLSMPQFLIEGDSAGVVGKLFNYTSDTYSGISTFTMNNQVVNKPVSLQAKSSFIRHYPVYALSSMDSLAASFSINANTGFKDAEERKIPVLKKGIEEATGEFYVLAKDTTIHFTANNQSNAIQLYAQNNTLQLLLDETEHLKTYPYYCMEQTASKLRGLLMEKHIKEILKQPLDDDKTITYLINKLQKAQLYNGGWSWWENGTADLYITNYVINALLPLRKDAAIENSIRNGLLFLQNNISGQNKDALLQTLVTMGNAKHEIDYKPWLDKIAFDSLSQCQQWLYVKLKQQLRMAHQRELDTLLKYADKSILGSIHWGEQTWLWYNNATASTVLAFEVLSHEPAYKNLLPGIVQYFLEQRKNDYWINTVESASIVAVILPYTLSQQEQFMQPATLQVSGDTVLHIASFPYKATLPVSNIRQLNIQKQGGGITYFTLYQNVWNRTPQPVQNSFVVTTNFEKDNLPLSTLQTGEKVILKAEVKALKEADYVMIEIPIPAGCTYAEKPQNYWQMHTEYLKNKIVLFVEHLSKGMHTYEVQLEVRYSGSYTINPAKVSLMYFPTFYGSGAMKNISIKGEQD